MLNGNRSAKEPLNIAFARNPATGELYLAWHDNRFAGDHFHYDIVFTRSIDGGKHWSTSVRVSDVQGTPNFKPWLSCSTGGRLDLIYFSRRLDRANRSQDVFYQASGDGGRTWTRGSRVTERSFDPYLVGGVA